MSAGPAPRVPVVLLPGLLGSRLGLRGGPLIWGDVRNFYRPVDGGRALMVEPGASSWGDVEPRGLIESIPIVPYLIEIPVYRDLIRHLVRAGYALGRTLFTHGYDFRQDTLSLVRGLAAAVEEVGRATGAPEVVLLGHSHGGVLASYLARFGTADRTGASEDLPAPLAESERRVRIRAVVALATGFRGSLDNLRLMVRGYRPAPLGFDFDPSFHVLARGPVETLPAPGTPCFADGSGDPLNVDVYDVAAWERHQLGVFAPAVRARLGEARTAEAGRLLARGLSRGARLHAAFREPPGPDVAPHVVIGSTSIATLTRAMLSRTPQGHWRCAFPGAEQDSDLVARATASGLYGPGDGEVTAASLRGWRGPEDGPVRAVQGLHRTLINQRDTCSAVEEVLSGLEAGHAAWPPRSPGC